MPMIPVRRCAHDAQTPDSATTARPFTSLLVATLLALAAITQAQASDESFGMKIFNVEPALYPFVQIYLRTFDSNMQPLPGLNPMDVGLMVNGQSYDPRKGQYVIQQIRDRDHDSVRAIFVLDTSSDMAGDAFEQSLNSVARFISAKRSNDQVAIITTDGSPRGYTTVSEFESDSEALLRRLADVEADLDASPLYDAIAGAMEYSIAPAERTGPGAIGSNYVATTSIVIFSDGHDTASALTRSDLMRRIDRLQIPVPIYSIGYNERDSAHLNNLRALSRTSFGQFYDLTDNLDQMTRTVENIHNIKQRDFVITFRSYVDPDGRDHNLRVGVQYPPQSGRYQYDRATFEAITPPNLPAITEMRKQLFERMESVDDPFASDPLEDQYR